MRAPTDPPSSNPDPTTYPSGTTELQTRAMGIAALTCIGFMLLGSLLGWLTTAEVDMKWYEALVRPGFQPPEVLTLLVALLYYPLFFVLIYRSLTRLPGASERKAAVTLAVTAMAINTAWNPLLIGFQALALGVIGHGILLGVIGLLAGFLWRRERLSAILLLPYVIWVAFDLLWALELLRLNP